MKKTIASHMLDVLEEKGEKVIHIGKPSLLDKCFERTNNLSLGKLNRSQRNQRILNALDKSPFFRKTREFSMKNTRCFEIAC